MLFAPGIPCLPRNVKIFHKKTFVNMRGGPLLWYIITIFYCDSLRLILFVDIPQKHASTLSNESQYGSCDKSSRIPLSFIKLYGVFTTLHRGGAHHEPYSMMKKLFPAISSCNINYETRKVSAPSPAPLYFFSTFFIQYTFTILLKET